MYEGRYNHYRHKLDAEAAYKELVEKQRDLQDARRRALHTTQIQEVYHKLFKIADLVYIQGYGEFLLDKNDNLIKVQKEQDNEL